RAVAADDALGGRDAGAVHENARDAVLLRGFLDGSRRAVGARHVAFDGDGADLLGMRLRGVEVYVEDRDLGAGFRERGGGGAAEARCASRYDGGMSPGIHQFAPLRFACSMIFPIMPL